MREMEKALKRFDASIERLLERITIREDEIEAIRKNCEIEEREKNKVLQAKRIKSIGDILEEVVVLIRGVPKHENRVTFSAVAVISLAERPATAEKVTR